MKHKTYLLTIKREMIREASCFIPKHLVMRHSVQPFTAMRISPKAYETQAGFIVHRGWVNVHGGYKGDLNVEFPTQQRLKSKVIAMAVEDVVAQLTQGREGS